MSQRFAVLAVLALVAGSSIGGVVAEYNLPCDGEVVTGTSETEFRLTGCTSTGPMTIEVPVARLTVVNTVVQDTIHVTELATNAVIDVEQVTFEPDLWSSAGILLNLTAPAVSPTVTVKNSTLDLQGGGYFTLVSAPAMTASGATVRIEGLSATASAAALELVNLANAELTNPTVEVERFDTTGSAALYSLTAIQLGNSSMSGGTPTVAVRDSVLAVETTWSELVSLSGATVQSAGITVDNCTFKSVASGADAASQIAAVFAYRAVSITDTSVTVTGSTVDITSWNSGIIALNVTDLIRATIVVEDTTLVQRVTSFNTLIAIAATTIEGGSARVRSLTATMSEGELVVPAQLPEGASQEANERHFTVLALLANSVTGTGFHVEDSTVSGTPGQDSTLRLVAARDSTLQGSAGVNVNRVTVSTAGLYEFIAVDLTGTGVSGSSVQLQDSTWNPDADWVEGVLLNGATLSTATVSVSDMTVSSAGTTQSAMVFGTRLGDVTSSTVSVTTTTLNVDAWSSAVVALNGTNMLNTNVRVADVTTAKNMSRYNSIVSLAMESIVGGSSELERTRSTIGSATIARPIEVDLLALADALSLGDTQQVTGMKIGSAGGVSGSGLTVSSGVLEGSTAEDATVDLLDVKGTVLRGNTQVSVSGEAPAVGGALLTVNAVEDTTISVGGTLVGSNGTGAAIRVAGPTVTRSTLSVSGATVTGPWQDFAALRVEDGVEVTDSTLRLAGSTSIDTTEGRVSGIVLGGAVVNGVRLEADQVTLRHTGVQSALLSASGAQPAGSISASVSRATVTQTTAETGGLFEFTTGEYEARSVSVEVRDGVQHTATVAEGAARSVVFRDTCVGCAARSDTVTVKVANSRLATAGADARTVEVAGPAGRTWGHAISVSIDASTLESTATTAASPNAVNASALTVSGSAASQQVNIGRGSTLSAEGESNAAAVDCERAKDISGSTFMVTVAGASTLAAKSSSGWAIGVLWPGDGAVSLANSTVTAEGVAGAAATMGAQPSESAFLGAAGSDMRGSLTAANVTVATSATAAGAAFGWSSAGRWQGTASVTASELTVAGSSAKALADLSAAGAGAATCELGCTQFNGAAMAEADMNDLCATASVTVVGCESGAGEPTTVAVGEGNGTVNTADPAIGERDSDQRGALTPATTAGVAAGSLFLLLLLLVAVIVYRATRKKELTELEQMEAEKAEMADVAEPAEVEPLEFQNEADKAARAQVDVSSSELGADEEEEMEDVDAVEFDL